MNIFGRSNVIEKASATPQPRRNIKRGAVLLTSCAALVLAACGTGDSASDVRATTLQLDFVYTNGYEALAYGVDQGYFTDEGIDLKVVSGRGSTLALQQLASNKTDFAMSSLSTYIQQRLRGEGDALAIYAFINIPPICIAAHEPLEGPSDMIGKTFGTIAQSAGRTTVPYVLQQNGVRAEDVPVKIFDVSLLLTQLIDGEIDTAESQTIGSWVRDQATARKAGKELHCTPLSDWGYKDYGKVLLVNRSTLEQDPELVESLVSALHKSWTEAVHASDDEIFAAMKKANPQATPEAVEASWAGQLELVKDPGPLDEDVVGYSLAFSEDSLGIESDIAVTELYDNSFIPGQ